MATYIYINYIYLEMQVVECKSFDNDLTSRANTVHRGGRGTSDWCTGGWTMVPR